MSSGDALQIEDMPLELLSAPLDWFFFEHLRHRQLCRLIDEVAQSAEFEARSVARVVRFLRFERPLHILDEEEDLFPLLRRRSLPEDELEGILDLLSADHRADADRAGEARAILEQALAEGSLPDGEGTPQVLLGFASHERQHLALENAVVLPIARLRLTPEDLDGLAGRLAARRGLTLERREPDGRGQPAPGRSLRRAHTRPMASGPRKGPPPREGGQ